jgi:glycosyltransferase involved in cell wall biosynthesis
MRHAPDKTVYHKCSWRMRRWFARIVRQIRPDAILINYAYADGFIDHRRRGRVHRVIEMHDLWSLNRRMAAGIEDRMEKFVRTGTPGELFDLGLGWASEFAPDPEELAIYDRYDVVIAISRQEQLFLQNRLGHARIVVLPPHFPPVELANTYAAAPLLVASNNPFNRLGLLLFIHRILPRLRDLCPDFQIDIAGDVGQVPLPADGVRYLGYIPDLTQVFRQAAFFLCPVFAGTGKQVKIPEAMAHGLAVVAFSAAAAESPLHHDENGLIARDPAEFAGLAAKLWQDRALCRKFGSAARAAMPSIDPAAQVLHEILAGSAA